MPQQIWPSSFEGDCTSDVGHDNYWSNTERRKESLVKGKNSNNPCNQQSRVHRKSKHNSLEIQKKQSKTEARKNTFVKKSNKVGENRTQSKFSMNRKNPKVRNMQIIKSLRCLPWKTKLVTQKLMLQNTQLLRKDLGNLET